MAGADIQGGIHDASFAMEQFEIRVRFGSVRGPKQCVKSLAHFCRDTESSKPETQGSGPNLRDRGGFVDERSQPRSLSSGKNRGCDATCKAAQNTPLRGTGRPVLILSSAGPCAVRSRAPTRVRWRDTNRGFPQRRRTGESSYGLSVSGCSSPVTELSKATKRPGTGGAGEDPRAGALRSKQ